jgi:Immunity protein 8
MLIGRHYLFVDRIDTVRIEAFINDRLRRLDGDTWRQLAQKIAHIAYWEFEDYTEPPMP